MIKSNLLGYLSLDEIGSPGENDLDLRSFLGGDPDTRSRPPGEIDLRDFDQISLESRWFRSSSFLILTLSAKPTSVFNP